ncbi:metallophosphoesterase [Alkalicoccobacillus murimartini]|uniref:MPP superfamily phosphohydrolase n=1 Tax=Alkalicoccobacillus murimartini TaxID=171685 RepID=A0ABT9YCD7_9BACI|nr:metallophosphoesterase [Alkalicoccobacillus murimartini]MDQ0205389.1 putative MPP superfamily phosphohydrolase [Alkalicoccobacillus murimartini]
MNSTFGLILSLALYGAICFYIGYNGWRWAKAALSFKWKKTYIVLFCLLASGYILSIFLSSRILQLIGGYWLVIFGYCCIALPIINLIYFLSKKNIKWKIYSGYTMLAIFTFVLIYGSYNAWNPVVRDYSIELNNPDKEPQGQELKLLIAADLHLGEVIGENHLQRFIDVAQQEDPDLILLAGDIIDNSISPYFANNLSETMKQLDPPLGVYAVPGNHDYYGGDLYLLRDEFKDIGFNFLMDDLETVNDQLTIIGRSDYTDKDRQSIEELMSQADDSLPVIMLDHQPREITEAQENGVDLIVSGHTHRGQVFPANFITSAIYENDWGHLQKDQLHSITSSGFGFWGPALRIGSRSEVMTVTFSY